MSELRVAGFEAVELLGYGSGGEVWLARERTTGQPVALKRLSAGADLAARDRLRREAAVLAGVDHPHVVRLRAVVGDGDGLVLVLDLAPGGSLARLLATRRLLDAGEVVTLGVPLAQALAAVHSQGLVHGDVTPSNVLFAADGRPLLSDLGVSRLLGTTSGAVHGTRGFLDPAVAAGGAQGPASDVHGLAATCLAALTGTAPYDDSGHRVPVPAGTHPGLVAALESALLPDPLLRPTADELAVAVFDAAPPAPVRLEAARARIVHGGGVGGSVVEGALTHRVVRSPPAPPPDPRSPGRGAGRRTLRRPRRLPRRPAVLVAAGAVAATATLGMAVVAGVRWAGADDEPTAAGVPGARVVAERVAQHAAATDWSATLGELDRSRSRAFAVGDPALLKRVYATGSPALARDEQALARLTASGLRAAGLRLRVATVGVESRSPGRVRLGVTDVMPPYRLVDGGGEVVASRPGRGERSWTVVLTRDGGRWRVYDVVKR